MEQTDLERVIVDEVKPLVDEATQKFIGVNIGKLSDDITSKLNRSSLMDIEIDTTLNYRQARKKFRRAFLTKLLLLNYGNISEVAKKTGKSRRSIHRMIKTLHINVRKIKRELLRPYEIRLSRINTIIGTVLDQYKTVVHPDRLRDMYHNVSSLSEDILKRLPHPDMTFKEAETEFEQRYFKSMLAENDKNISRTARKIGLRYETLQRKLKALGMV